MTAYRWGFDIIGMNWVHSLSYDLHGPDITILRDEEDERPPVFFWTSAHLSDLDVGPELTSRAGALKILFDGALFLINGLNFRPEALGELIDLKNDRRTGVYGSHPGASAFSDSVLNQPLDRTHTGVVRERLLEGSLFLARTDPVARGMLGVLGTHGVTLPSLYALRDFMNSEGMSDADIAAAGKSSAKEFSNFRHTANSFAAVGVASRHGLTKQQPPQTPMTIERAAEIVLEASRKFISQRILSSASLPPLSPHPSSAPR